MTQTAQTTKEETAGREGGERKGWDRGNINETRVREKYWADVVLQMHNALAHVSGCWGAAMNAAKQQGDDVELETTEGEQQRGAEMC